MTSLQRALLRLKVNKVLFESLMKCQNYVKVSKDVAKFGMPCITENDEV